MSFRDQSFQQRLQAMGDEAEAVFEEVWPTPYVRFGLNRPPVSMSRMSAFVRYTPDYLTSNQLVEVMGLGRDRTFKLKLEKLNALQMWDLHHETHLFVWDTTTKRWTSFPVREIEPAMSMAQIATFPEGKAYVGIAVDSLPGPWSSC